MTNEERIAKLAELREKAEGLAKDYNDAMQNDDMPGVRDAEKGLDETIKEHTAIARAICFEECKASENPMVEAVTRLFFTTIAVKDEKGEDEGALPVRTIIDRNKQIDLKKLHKYIDGGIGFDKGWLNLGEKMNFLLTAQKAVDLGIDPKEINDSYAMSEISKKLDMGKNPTSKTNLLRTLQMVVTAMLGEEAKATSHDVNFLISVYSKKGKKALSVSCANHNYFRNYLAEVCHRIITGKPYEVEYKAAKK